jgi:hypothetical protein
MENPMIDVPRKNGRLLGSAGLVLAFAIPAAEAQGMWWVEGDRYCSGFANRGSTMCGAPRKGESAPKPTYRLEFTTPRVPLIDDDQARREIVPAPADRPAAAPTRTQPRP